MIESLEQVLTELNERARHLGPLRYDEIAGLFGDVLSCDVNCFPSKIPGPCCRTAYFFSLTGKTYARSRGHVSFRVALERLVQHMQGPCRGITGEAVLITDSVDPKAREDWQGSVDVIRRSGARVEAVLLQGFDKPTLPLNL